MDPRYQRLNATINDLLEKGGVQRRLESAGLDPTQLSIDLGDYGDYLIKNNEPQERMREEIAAQLLARMRTAEVMKFLRRKEFKEADKRGELPF